MKRLVQPGTTRVPRHRVLLDGKELPGIIESEVTSNSHYQADKHRLKIALAAPGGHDLAWWGADERKGMLFDVRMSMDGDERSFIIGEADRIDVHPETGEVEIEGRDLSARLIDNKLQEAFQNKTASEIATVLAERRGLKPVVTKTTTQARRYYDADHTQGSGDQFSRAGTEWDLLKSLAEHEGFDLYVKGTELHFEPAVDGSKAEPYAVRWDANSRVSEVRNLRLGRSLTLAKDVVVLVRSWSSAQGRAFTKASPQGAAKSAVNNGKAQRFVYTFPNLSEDQAQKKADSLREDITKHERTISFECPGELNLTIRDMIAMTGCGGWDQRYHIDTITRRLSAESGFTQNVAAKNHKTESAASTL